MNHEKTDPGALARHCNLRFGSQEQLLDVGLPVRN